MLRAPRTKTRWPSLLVGLTVSATACSPESPGDQQYSATPADAYPSVQAVDVSPSTGYASDDWVTSGQGPWSDEALRRDAELYGYLGDSDPARAAAYGFRQGQSPALAWDWFDKHPIGFGGMPYVLLQTILSLDPATETDPHLRQLAEIWKKPSSVPAETGQGRYTLDHLGFAPNPADYVDGVAVAPASRQHRLPNGFVFDPSIEPKGKFGVERRLRLMRDGVIGALIKRVDEDYTPRIARLLVLARGKIRRELYGGDLDYESEVDLFQEPPATDAVFFSCSGCHVGRVVVGGQLDDQGNVVDAGRMKFLPGMPTTEAEPQAFSKLLMETGLALVESGFSLDATALPASPDEVVPSTPAVLALYTRMLSRAIDPAVVTTIYGSSSEQVRRAQLQTYWVAKDFPTYVGAIIGTAIKTQYLYYQVGRTHGFNPANPRRTSPDQPVPDPLTGHIGQMDAFGAASGLVAIHTMRQDNSYLHYAYDDNPSSPLFTGLETIPGFEGSVTLDEAGQRIRETLGAWAPPVPAPIDIPAVTWTSHQALANWDGNQGASARALSSGTSATGDPRKVNVRIHEPFNAFMGNLPPSPYPFAVDQEMARRGKAIFEGEGLPPGANCSSCHSPNNPTIYSAIGLGVDENRSLVNTDVSRYGLAAIVMESCRIFIRKNPDNDWCLPRDEAGQLITDWDQSTADYFQDTPQRVRDGVNGYKADMLHGTWAQAPYLHNGSVPTLMQLVCPAARPARFKRGIVFYDPAMVGFEWDVAPQQRYSEHDSQTVREYNTGELSRSNSGHEYGSSLCPDLRGLDPVADRAEIVSRVLASPVADLLEYLKTL